MTNLKRFEVVYDVDGDVLYIAAPGEFAVRGIEDRPGVVWRYDGDGLAVGVTIIDFANYWYERSLVPEISEKLDVPKSQVAIILDHVHAANAGKPYSCNSCMGV